jgi:LDH2 family malate/lactate/ureidoglycolate dehydrogenase
MDIAIDKCAVAGSSCVAVRNSKHFGAAGYYAAMALEHDMVGCCMTNAGPGVLPTFGIEPQVGTNPIALAIPANKEAPFLLDMATSVRAANKLALLARAGEPVPDGWLLDEEGKPCHDPEFFARWDGSERRGGMLPLGGAGEGMGGYKGYSLSLAVELLTAVLTGDVASAFMDLRPGKRAPTVSHFFAAIRIDSFRPASDFKDEMDRLLAHIKASPKLPGADRIFVAGEKEHDCRIQREAHGVPLPGKLLAELEALARRVSVPFPKPIEAPV